MMTRSKSRKLKQLEPDENKENEEKLEQCTTSKTKKIRKGIKTIKDLTNAIGTQKDVDVPQTDPKLLQTAPPMSDMFIACRACQIVLRSFTDAATHKPETPETTCCFICEKCANIFGDALEFVVHVIEKNHHYYPGTEILGFRRSLHFECIECKVYIQGFNFLLSNHWLIKSNAACQFKCLNCGEIFRVRSMCFDHLIFSDCYKIFNSLYSRRRIEKAGSSEYNQKENTFNVSQSENKKEQKHIGLIKSPFICTVCYNIYLRKTHAAQHLKVHNFSSCACPDCQQQMRILEELP